VENSFSCALSRQQALATTYQTKGATNAAADMAAAQSLRMASPKWESAKEPCSSEGACFLSIFAEECLGHLKNKERGGQSSYQQLEAIMQQLSRHSQAAEASSTT